MVYPDDHTQLLGPGVMSRLLVQVVHPPRSDNRAANKNPSTFFFFVIFSFRIRFSVQLYVSVMFSGVFFFFFFFFLKRSRAGPDIGFSDFFFFFARIRSQG